MKKLTAIVLITISAASTAQTNTSINAVINGLKPRQWVYCRTFDGSKKDSVKTVQNGFHFKLSIPEGEGDVYLLQIGKGQKDNNTMMVYLDKGVVNIKGKGPGFKAAKASGTSAVMEWNDCNRFTEKDIRMKNAEAIYKKANDLYAKHDSVGLAALQPQLDFVDSVRTELIKQWVLQHPNSPISALMLSMELRYKLSIDELETNINRLSPAAKNNLPGKKILHSIEVDKLTGVGRIAPDFTQGDTLGNPVSLKEFRGKYLLVDFWASWCGPCRAENPNVVKAFNTYKGKNFTILGISFDSKKENWLKAIQNDGLAWNHVSDLKGWDNAVGKQYDILSIPANILIGPDGKIVAKDLRGKDLENKLSELLQ